MMSRLERWLATTTYEREGSTFSCPSYSTVVPEPTAVLDYDGSDEWDERVAASGA